MSTKLCLVHLHKLLQQLLVSLLVPTLLLELPKSSVLPAEQSRILCRSVKDQQVSTVLLLLLVELMEPPQAAVTAPLYTNLCSPLPILITSHLASLDSI
jgi:hypothetical protein